MQYLGHIVGDIMSSSGGVMFLFPNTSTSVAKIYIANGVQKSNKKIDIGVLTADAQSIVVPLENNMGSDAIAVRVRANNHFYYHNGTEFVPYANNSINKTQGGTLFTLNETLYAVEPIGTNYVDGFQVVDITNNKILATHAAQFATQAAAPNANCITAEIVGDYEARLYQYVPGQIAAQYTFKLTTSTGVEDVVTEKANMNIYVNNGTLFINGVEVENLTIYNMSGTLVANKDKVQQCELNLLNRGIYIVRVVDVDGNVHVAKFAI